jgi:NhaP-type Na+/H+ or K+/H+ antiporter
LTPNLPAAALYAGAITATGAAAVIASFEVLAVNYFPR